jgi:hypothetical protein
VADPRRRVRDRGDLRVPIRSGTGRVLREGRGAHATRDHPGDFDVWVDARIPSADEPECPTAFPIDFREFQQKRARLCGSDEEQRDTLLRTRGGAAKAFSDAQRREIDRVNRAYYLQ